MTTSHVGGRSVTTIDDEVRSVTRVDDEVRSVTKSDDGDGSEGGGDGSN